MMDLDAFRRQSLDTWGAMAATWESRHAFLERNLGHLSDWMIERTSPSNGQVVLDVGAGPGDLGHRIAPLVGSEGRVISTDFSPEMVEVARRLGSARGLDNVEYRQLDAEAMDLDDDSIDVLVGRAVYMLVADPGAGFTEARRVLRPGGSMAIAVFTSPAANPWAAVPAGVLVEHGHLQPPPPGVPGVFALGDATQVRDLATGAGFTDVLIEHVDFAYRYADEDDAWNAITDLNGPLAVVIRGLSDDERIAVRQAVLDRYGQFRESDGSFPVPAQSLALLAR